MWIGVESINGGFSLFCLLMPFIYSPPIRPRENKTELKITVNCLLKMVNIGNILRQFTVIFPCLVILLDHLAVKESRVHKKDNSVNSLTARCYQKEEYYFPLTIDTNCSLSLVI